MVTAWTKETFEQEGLLGRENKIEVVLKRYVIHALTKLIYILKVSYMKDYEKRSSRVD